MGSSNPSPVSPHQHKVLAAQADALGFVRFDTFMATALYDPVEGYYRRDRNRIGKSSASDFFTASSLGPVFGELVVASVQTLLKGRNPAKFTFVELGAEVGRSVLDGVDHPFAAVRLKEINDSLPLQGPCVVFSNELFDAQPFRRFVMTSEGWNEEGIRITETGIEPAQISASDSSVSLPPNLPEGYRIDYPSDARQLLCEIAGQPWHGLFLSFDYGKSWKELITACPHGTLRAYHHHRQSTDLLARMGEQDLTGHICWDHLTADLKNARFSTEPVSSQEAFLVKNAGSRLAKIMTTEAGRLSSRKSGMMQLLHPSSLGQKFQVLSAWRAPDEEVS